MSKKKAKLPHVLHLLTQAWKAAKQVKAKPMMNPMTKVGRGEARREMTRQMVAFRQMRLLLSFSSTTRIPTSEVTRCL